LDEEIIGFTLAFTLMLMAPLSVLAVENNNVTDNTVDGGLPEERSEEPGGTTDGESSDPSVETLPSLQRAIYLETQWSQLM
jgi:hypothetical protein